MRGARVLDRLAVAVVGLLLVAGGLMVLDFCLELSGGFPDRPNTTPVVDALDASWWPWAAGGAGVVLVLGGLWWLLARLPRRSSSSTRLSGSGPEGRLVVDLSSVADAVAEQLASLAPLARSRATVVSTRGGALLEVRADLAEGADLASVTEAAQVVEGDVRAAFPDDDVAVRVLVAAPPPARRRRRRRDTVRVREAEVSPEAGATPTAG